MATKQQPQTKVIEVINCKGLTKEKLLEKAPLGSPINGREVGEEFPVTLTGKIEIREFNGRKGAYFTTKEGYSIRVNASFDEKKHAEGKVFQCVCKLLPKDVENNILRDVKFTAFVNES